MDLWTEELAITMQVTMILWLLWSERIMETKSNCQVSSVPWLHPLPKAESFTEKTSWFISFYFSFFLFIKYAKVPFSLFSSFFSNHPVTTLQCQAYLPLPLMASSLTHLSPNSLDVRKIKQFWKGMTKGK